MHLRQRSCKYEACTIETFFRILMGEGTATEKITSAIDRSRTNAQFGGSQPQKIPCTAPTNAQFGGSQNSLHGPH
jgi:hypothetical protein